MYRLEHTFSLLTSNGLNCFLKNLYFYSHYLLLKNILLIKNDDIDLKKIMTFSNDIINYFTENYVSSYMWDFHDNLLNNIKQE
jgi:hypothetical protein